MSFLLTLWKWMLNAQSQNYLERLFFHRDDDILSFSDSKLPQKNCTWKEEPIVDLQVVLFFKEFDTYFNYCTNAVSDKTCNVARWLGLCKPTIGSPASPCPPWTDKKILLMELEMNYESNHRKWVFSTERKYTESSQFLPGGEMKICKSCASLPRLLSRWMQHACFSLDIFNQICVSFFLLFFTSRNPVCLVSLWISNCVWLGQLIRKTHSCLMSSKEKKIFSLLNQEVENNARDVRAESKSHDCLWNGNGIWCTWRFDWIAFLLVTVLAIPSTGHWNTGNECWQ